MSKALGSSKEFLETQTALIVETSDTFFAAIRDALCSFGLSTKQIVALKRYREAEQFLRTQKPSILVTEYQIGDNLGLGLCELHQEVTEGRVRVGIIVTKNSSDSAVAEAAEGQIDAYILKPFSGADFRKRLSEVLERKLHPSDYLRCVARGNEQQKRGELERALEIFTEAKTMDAKPSLACRYSGNVYLAQNRLDLALREFREGRSYQELNYKCLVGEFDALMAMKEYQQAHSLVTSIKKNFPITSGRLSQFFIAAVFSKKFEELNELYELFSKLDNRPEPLVKLILVAFMTAGQHYLKINQPTKAVEAFEIGIRVSGRRMDYLEKVLNECLKARLPDAVDKFLKMLPVDSEGLVKKAQFQFRSMSQSDSSETLMETGRKIVMDGNGTPEIAEILVQLLVKSEKRTLAETIIHKISEQYPECRAGLYKILFKEG